MAKYRKKEQFEVDYKLLLTGIIVGLIALIIKEFSPIRIILMIVATIIITIAIVNKNKVFRKYPRYIFVTFLVMLFASFLADTITVAMIGRIPVYTISIVSTEKARVYNGIGYRVWQCDKENYNDLKVDMFSTKGYRCDGEDIEEMDSNSFLNSVVTNYDDYKNQYVKIRGKISGKNGRTGFDMQAYTESEITVNGYVNFADNITLRVLFNEPESKLDNYDIYDEILVVGQIKNLESTDSKYVIYMADSKILSTSTYSTYTITANREYKCTDQSEYIEMPDYNLYTYCLEPDINVSLNGTNYELSSVLSSGKVTIDDILSKTSTVNTDENGNKIYKYKNYNIVKCNPEKSKDIIITSSDTKIDQVSCTMRIKEDE